MYVAFWETNIYVVFCGQRFTAGHGIRFEIVHGI